VGGRTILQIPTPLISSPWALSYDGALDRRLSLFFLESWRTFIQHLYAMVGFKCGNFVRLQGLSNAAYNGKLARIKSLGADENTGRFRVEVQVGEDLASNLSREFLVKVENMARACDGCRHAGAATMQYCGQCKNAAYCNAECQRNDWKRHKVDCSLMSSQRRIVKSPLLLAATKGNLAAVQDLVREGADVNKASKEDGNTALHMASEQGHLAIVQYLIQRGADKDKAMNTSLCSS
jgi:hypothetical protein